MSTVRRLAASASLAFAALALSACAPKSASELGHKLVVHGVVTDAALLTPLKGVKVTLLSSDRLSPVTTDDRGYFQFVNVLQIDNLLVQFQFDGYGTITATVNPTIVKPGAAGVDGGIPAFPGFGDDVDGFDASIALKQLVLVPVAGTVYDATGLAKGAAVLLVTPDGTVGYQAKTGDDGRFSFAGVRPATWMLQVLPFDRDADGLTDTQFYSQTFDLLAASAANLGNLVVVLKDVQRALVASSFANLSKAYPITAADLVAGLTGVLPAPGNALFLHFGAEVDAALTSFELVQVEPGPRYSAPIGVTVTWEKGSVARLATASVLGASSDATIGYELRIRSLRFKDGTPGINPAPTGYGTIGFTVLALPVALPGVQPALYLASKFTATQAATTAVVDQSTIWLLDGNGDFVFDTAPGSNFNNATGMLLSWTHAPGAVRYHVMARNTTSAGASTTANLDWRELANVGAPDPTVNSTVVLSVNPWTGGTSGSPLGTGGAPWAFGNHVLFTVVSEDALGFRSPIDPSKTLDTSDTFPGLLTGSEVDPAGMPFPFTSTLERGATFTKTLRASFSEPMSTTAAPTLTSGSANVTIKKVLASAWGTSTTAPSATPLNTSQHAFFSAQLSVKGACTELLVDRATGDLLLPVRDASFFAPSSSGRALFLSTGGAFLGEAVGIAASDAATNRVTLTTALVPGLSAGSLVCSLQAPAAVTSFVSTNATSVTVGDPSAFYVGESVLVYEPQVNGAGQIADLRTVTGVDTVAKVLLLNAALSAAHTSASVVLPVTLGGEVGLRSSAVLTLQKDALGAAGVELFFTGPANVLAGDWLQVDVDGDLKTTLDQAVVVVKQVKFAPTGVPATWSLIVDLPALTLLHGKATFRAMGDAFQVGGTKDSSSGAVKPLDTHRDQFSVDGVLF